MVHSGVYLNKHVVSMAPFSTPAFTPTPIQKNAFCMFSLFNFSFTFPKGQLTPFASSVRTPMHALCLRDRWTPNMTY